MPASSSRTVVTPSNAHSTGERVVALRVPIDESGGLDETSGVDQEVYLCADRSVAVDAVRRSKIVSMRRENLR